VGETIVEEVRDFIDNYTGGVARNELLPIDD
jgi:hypothetical protein